MRQYNIAYLGAFLGCGGVRQRSRVDRDTTVNYKA